MAFDDVLRAAKDNDVKSMVSLIAADRSSAKASNAIGQTGLHVAGIWGNFEVGRVLLEAGADVNAQNQFGLTPLFGAVQGDHLEFAKMLIEAGANPRIRASNGKVASDVASSDEMRLLCKGRALQSHQAVSKNDVKALEALLTTGDVDLSEQDQDGDTPLHLAVASPYASDESTSAVLDLLLAAAAAAKGFIKALGTRNDAGLMPLHVAASRLLRSAPVCEALLQAGANVDAISVQNDEYMGSGQWGKKNESGQLEKLSSAGTTALHMAVQQLHDEAEEAADFGDENPRLDTNLVRVLLAHGANPNVRDPMLMTPLHIAIMGGLHDVVELLCAAKADLTLGCKPFGANNTALHQATITRDVRMIALLAEYGASLDALGRDGWTPLGIAVRSNAVATAKALLEARANVHAKTGPNGQTPIEVATANLKGKPAGAKSELLLLLEQHVAQQADAFVPLEDFEQLVVG